MGQLIEKRLVVVRHFHVLLGTETPHGSVLDADPGGLEQPFHGQCPPGTQAVGHGFETFQGEGFALCRIKALDRGRQRGQELGKSLTLGHRLGIGVGQRVIDLGAVFRITIVDLTDHIGNRQDARLGPGEHVVDMADFLPLETGAFRQGRMPVAHQGSTVDGVERRQVLVHIVQHPILGPLGGVVLADFLVTTVVADAARQRQVHHAVAMAHAVVGIVLQERHRLGQRTVNDKVVVGGKHHVRRGHAHHAVGEFVLQFPVVVLRHVQVFDRIMPLRDFGVGLRGGIQHQQFARQRAVELHRPAQERRPVVGDQHHRQQIPQELRIPRQRCLFRNVVALHNLSSKLRIDQ